LGANLLDCWSSTGWCIWAFCYFSSSHS
jgi:hypothetical protein